MSHRAKFWFTAALAFGLAAFAGFIIGRLIPVTGGAENPALVLPLAFVAIVFVAIAVWFWWKNTDDLQQQGQLISWWWGGNFGAVIMLVCVVVLTGRHSDLSRGAFYLFCAEFGGMLIVWLIWKLRGGLGFARESDG